MTFVRVRYFFLEMLVGEQVGGTNKGYVQLVQLLEYKGVVLIEFVLDGDELLGDAFLMFFECIFEILDDLIDWCFPDECKIVSIDIFGNDGA